MPRCRAGLKANQYLTWREHERLYHPRQVFEKPSKDAGKTNKYAGAEHVRDNIELIYHKLCEVIMYDGSYYIIESD